MDFDTGIVGKKRRVSYQTFHEDLEYLPPQGSTAGARRLLSQGDSLYSR